ncbi:uncharacterized protein LOC121391999 [Gigantopelta aegis]|uniref:uncharacterized protein LOC121391999 n=1 Tax=Gigantopelta aegis TaxID=1735272 RepID=UPI001B8898CC|nr:uncharacterized protein LOC121391999 [Gigantopelta aegis]
MTPLKALKRRLSSENSSIRTASFTTSLQYRDLRDRKPMQLLRHMQQLLGDKATALDLSIFMRELFLQCPPYKRQADFWHQLPMAISLQELATLADKVMEVATPTVATVSPSDSLLLRFSELKAEIAQVKTTSQNLDAVFPVHEQASPGRAHSSFPSLIQILCWVSSEVWRGSRKLQTTLLSEGKHPGPVASGMGVTGLNEHSRLFYIVEHVINYLFSLYSAEVSIIPSTAANKNNRCLLTLQTVNNSPILTFGTRSLTLTQSWTPSYVPQGVCPIAEVKTLLLSADDFLRHYGLLVDMGTQTFDDKVTNYVSKKSHHTNPPSPHSSTQNTHFIV